MLVPLLVLLGCLAARVQQADGPLASGLVRALELEPLPGTVVQHFRIDDERPGKRERPLGIMRFVSESDPEGGLRVELELQYLEQGLRVIHTEQGTRAQRRLVFRELDERSGRTLFLQGAPEKGYESYELGGREVVRKTQAVSGELPLFLVEAARRGRPLPLQLSVFDPLAARFEPVQLASHGGGEERALELRREDGSLRWRVIFRGELPIEWRWQEQGPVARAIAPEEYEHVRSEHERCVRAAAEAAAMVRPGPVLER